MKYDFTTLIDRHNHDAIAIDSIGNGGFAPSAPKDGFDVIPMWVADMNFVALPAIQDAVIERVKHPAYGYYNPSDAYYKAIIDWQVNRNGCNPKDLTNECIGYENGVIGGVISAMHAFASQGDSVLVHSPTYIGFTFSLTDNGYNIVHSPLVKDEQGVWRMDYEDMDKKIKENHIHIAIFCSPHNPCGRVWEKWEIEKAMEVYRNNDVVVISDEIWSDILIDGAKHIPTQSVNEDAKNRTIALYAPSKTFNLAGLIGSYHIIYNSYLRDRIRAESSKGHYNNMNVLSMHALIGAYSEEGYIWVDELKQVLSENVNYAYNYIQEHLEGVSTFKAQGTYMLFLDCEEWCKKNGYTLEQLEKACWDVGVAVQDGKMFHGEYALRMNLASPLSRIKEACERLDQYVFNKK